MHTNVKTTPSKTPSHVLKEIYNLTTEPAAQSSKIEIYNLTTGKPTPKLPLAAKSIRNTIADIRLIDPPD